MPSYDIYYLADNNNNNDNKKYYRNKKRDEIFFIYKSIDENVQLAVCLAGV